MEITWTRLLARLCLSSVWKWIRVRVFNPEYCSLPVLYYHQVMQYVWCSMPCACTPTIFQINPNTSISCNIGKSAINIVGIFRFFNVKTYLHIFIQQLMFFKMVKLQCLFYFFWKHGNSEKCWYQIWLVQYSSAYFN